MNLEESGAFKEELEKNNRNKKGIIISIILCALLIVFLFMMIKVISYQDANTEKMFLNDKQISIPEGFYKIKEDKIYVNIREMGALLGYNYTKGEYGEYNENEDSCYLQNDCEILAITAGSEKFTKYIEITTPEFKIAEIEVTSKNDNGYSETFKLENPVIYEDGILYVEKEFLPQMFNIQLDWQEFRINFYSLDYIINVAKTYIAKYGIKEMSGYYENLRALIYGYAVVGNATETTPSDVYGVISLATGKEIISLKYDDIVFVQNAQDFYITAANGTVGILNGEGGTVIAPSEFEEITVLDDENKLYLVSEDNEYGVLDKNGKVIVYAENDKIGIDASDFKSDDIENDYLLFGKCIPVEKDRKFGLYNIEGEIVLDSVYDGFGYKTESRTTSSGSEESVLIIPSYVGINGIVVNYNDLYGIYDVNAGLILPTVFEKIYSITKSGERTYYLQYNGEQINLADYLKEQNLNNVDEQGNLLTQSTSNHIEINAEDSNIEN